MSAKITVIVYILICFEVGILLLILPWYPWGYWEDNFFLHYVTNKFNVAWIPALLTSGYVKGIVTGIGVLNILAGLLDVFKFRESVAALVSLGNGENDKESPVRSISTESRSIKSGENGSTESRSTESRPIESRPTEPRQTESRLGESGPSESRPAEFSSTQPIALSAEHNSTQPVAISDHRPTGIPPQR